MIGCLSLGATPYYPFSWCRGVRAAYVRSRLTQIMHIDVMTTTNMFIVVNEFRP